MFTSSAGLLPFITTYTLQAGFTYYGSAYVLVGHDHDPIIISLGNHSILPFAASWHILCQEVVEALELEDHELVDLRHVHDLLGAAHQVRVDHTKDRLVVLPSRIQSSYQRLPQSRGDLTHSFRR